jgi:hypothetical protein
MLVYNNNNDNNNNGDARGGPVLNLQRVRG